MKRIISDSNPPETVATSDEDHDELIEKLHQNAPRTPEELEKKFPPIEMEL